MPAYNAGIYLAESVQSVLSQSYEDWELIIIDNCSTDETYQLAEEFSRSNEKVRVLQTQKNTGGPAGPRNLGVEHARGEYLAFIDSDDIWRLEKLSEQILLANGFSLVCTLCDKIDEEGNSLSSIQKVEDRRIDYNQIVVRNCIIASSVLVNKKKFESVMFDEEKNLNGFEDYNAFLRFLGKYGQGIVIGKPLVDYRVASDSLGGKIPYQKRFALSMYCLIKASVSLENNSFLIRGILRRYLSYLKSKFNDRKRYL